MHTRTDDDHGRRPSDPDGRRPRVLPRRRPPVPPIPARLLDPRPALAVGTLAWAVGAVVVFVLGHGFDRRVVLCLAGVAVGVVGYGVYGLQRRAVERGRTGAQRGLDFDAPR